MPESLTPITREETYLAAIAGEEVSVPDPICRKEEFLDAIDDHIGSVESDVSNVSGAVTALQTQIPASTAEDEGKVLTAGSTAGTASWQTPSGGGGVVLTETLVSSNPGVYSLGKSYNELMAYYTAGTPVFLKQSLTDDNLLYTGISPVYSIAYAHDPEYPEEDEWSAQVIGVNGFVYFSSTVSADTVLTRIMSE